MKHYDIIIAGGGGAGLGLACALLESPLRGCSLMIIDRDAKQQNDRTWCFWGGPETPFTSIARHAWDRLMVTSDGFEQVYPMEDPAHRGWRYWMVSGADYYRHTLQKLQAHPNVHFVLGSVDSIQSDSRQAQVRVNGETFTANWVFDSILRPGDLEVDPRRHHVLKQHFEGWEIETPLPTFDPSRATLFDFRTPQHNDLRFFYVLPFSTTRALVEYTIFSADLLKPAEYSSAMRSYLREHFGVTDFNIQHTEHAWIPMTDYPFQRRAGPRVMNIGTRGGLVKPSTGYAFKRMQQDARAIVQSLVENGHPFNGRRAPARYRFYDTLLLQILLRQGHLMKPIFEQLFRRNPIHRVFHFLDEDASLPQDIALIASLPPAPFLRALLRVYLRRKV